MDNQLRKLKTLATVDPEYKDAYISALERGGVMVELACACGGIAEVWFAGAAITFIAGLFGYKLTKGRFVKPEGENIE